MSPTATLDRTAIELKVEKLSAEIPATRDVLRKLDLVQERCALRSTLAALRSTAQPLR
jgi:hypothetical protein